MGCFTKEKEDLINRQFSVSVPHPMGGNTIWTCVKDNIIEENEDYEYIGIRGFYYKLFGEEDSGGFDRDYTDILI